MLDSIPDTRLRLALLDEVYADRFGFSWLTELPELRAKYEAGCEAHRAPAWGALGEDPNPFLEELVLGLPVEAEALRALDSLTLDGDRGVYYLESWWDLGDQFVIHDLRGLDDACPNLTRLDLGQGVVEGASLAPLAQLPKLARLSLCHTGNYRDVAVLGTLKLASIWALNVPPEDTTWRAALEALKQRGTRVE